MACMNYEEIIQQAMLGKIDKTDAIRLLQFELDNYDVNNSELFKPKKIYDPLAWKTDEAKYEYNSAGNERANREKNLLKKGIENIKNILSTNNNEPSKREENIMAIPKPFNGDTTCLLCGSPAKTLPNFEAYAHLQCRDCGEYSITLQAEAELKNFPDIKYILSGLAFENSYAGSPIQIKSGDVLNAKNKPVITTIEKMYKLANYLYSETIKLGLGQEVENIPMACCYAKDKNEFFSLWDILRTKNIILFERITHNMGENTAIYTTPVFTVQAKTIFDEGINSVEGFREIYMNDNKEGSGIFITGSNNQVIATSGKSKVEATQNNSVNMTELKKPEPKRNIKKFISFGMKVLIAIAGILASIVTILKLLE